MPALCEHVSLRTHKRESRAAIEATQRYSCMWTLSATSTLCESLALLGFFHSDPSIAVPDTNEYLFFGKTQIREKAADLEKKDKIKPQSKNRRAKKSRGRKRRKEKICAAKIFFDERTTPELR